jgi:hypothetical protein
MRMPMCRMRTTRTDTEDQRIGRFALTRRRTDSASGAIDRSGGSSTVGKLAVLQRMARESIAPVLQVVILVAIARLIATARKLNAQGSVPARFTSEPNQAIELIKRRLDSLRLAHDVSLPMATCMATWRSKAAKR